MYPRPGIVRTDWRRSEETDRILKSQEKINIDPGGNRHCPLRLSLYLPVGAFGITMYHLFTNRMEAMMSENAVQLLDQTATNLESYLKNMRRISDTMYYSVIKDKDLASEDMVQEMNLLYDANKENLVSIACYTSRW